MTIATDVWSVSCPKSVSTFAPSHDNAHEQDKVTRTERNSRCMSLLHEEACMRGVRVASVPCQLAHARMFMAPMTSNTTVPHLVSYHYPCPDGVFAALAAHLAFAKTAETVAWIPNTVYAPRKLDDLKLQVQYCWE